MKSKILILTMCVFAVVTFANCDKDDKKTSENVLLSCDPQTEFIGERNNIETVIVKLNPEIGAQWPYPSSIVIFQMPWDTEPTAYFIRQQEGMGSSARICNYPQWAKDWEIPEGGLQVIISGKFYEPSYGGGEPANHSSMDMELTSIKKK